MIFILIDLAQLDIFICGYGFCFFMHDTEPDTFVLKTWPEKYRDMLKEIGVDSQTKDIGTDDVEKGDYYSRYFAHTARMITNKGTLDVKNSNVDVIQIIQKG